MMDSFQYKFFGQQFLNHASLIKFIGKGTFGKVYACKGPAPGMVRNALLAAKFVDYDSSLNDMDYTYLGGLNHPNVVTYYGTGEYVHLAERTYIIVCEFCNGKSNHTGESEDSPVWFVHWTDGPLW